MSLFKNLHPYYPSFRRLRVTQFPGGLQTLNSSSGPGSSGVQSRVWNAR